MNMSYKHDAFISGVEFSLDWGDKIPEEDLEKYNKLIRIREKRFKRKKIIRRFKMWFKKRWWVLSAVLIVAGVFGLFFFLNALSEEIRGYKAVGGEIFVIFLPVALIFGRDLIHEVLDIFK